MLLADDTEPAVIRAAISEETVAASWTPTTSPWSSRSAPPLRYRHSWRYLELIDADTLDARRPDGVHGTEAMAPATAPCRRAAWTRTQASPGSRSEMRVAAGRCSRVMAAPGVAARRLPQWPAVSCGATEAATLRLRGRRGPVTLRQPGSCWSTRLRLVVRAPTAGPGRGRSARIAIRPRAAPRRGGTSRETIGPQAPRAEGTAGPLHASGGAMAGFEPLRSWCGVLASVNPVARVQAGHPRCHHLQ